MYTSVAAALSPALVAYGILASSCAVTGHALYHGGEADTLVSARFTVGVGVANIIGAAALALYSVGAEFFALYFAVSGVVIAGAALLMGKRYRPRIDTSTGVWEPTGERFIDPTTKQLVEVHYNPTTGQRNYVPVEDPPTPIPDDQDRQLPPYAG